MFTLRGALTRLGPLPLRRRVVQIATRSCSASAGEGERVAYTNITVETQGYVQVISINRPEKRNCVNQETAEELYNAFRSFDKDEEVRVGVLCGKGGTFCAGYDLTELAAVEDVNPDDLLRPFGVGPAPMGPTRLILSKPVIAAVTGHAVAGGLELALTCDMRVVEEDATFGVFCRRFGVPLLDGGTVRLPALIGLSRAMDMILTGRAVGAKEALDIGLANRIVPNGEALGTAIELANQIAAFPQACLRADRKSAHHSTYSGSTLKGSLALEHRNGVTVLGDAVKGAQTFVKGAGRGGTFDLHSKL